MFQVFLYYFHLRLAAPIHRASTFRPFAQQSPRLDTLPLSLASASCARVSTSASVATFPIAIAIASMLYPLRHSRRHHCCIGVRIRLPHRRLPSPSGLPRPPPHLLHLVHACLHLRLCAQRHRYRIRCDDDLINAQCHHDDSANDGQMLSIRSISRDVVEEMIILLKKCSSQARTTCRSQMSRFPQLRFPVVVIRQLFGNCAPIILS
jgi:hypothetical protein